jgi:hypothetical protein
MSFQDSGGHCDAKTVAAHNGTAAIVREPPEAPRRSVEADLATLERLRDRTRQHHILGRTSDQFPAWQ